MQGPTLDELRELSRRSRRSQRWAFGAMGALFLLFPMQLALAGWVSATWAAVAAAALGGTLLVRYAFVAGKERGAFRRVFRRLREERDQTRTLVPEAPAEPVVIERA